MTHQVMPVYPPIAKQAHISGTVVLHCIIGKDGSVQQLEFVSGPPLLMKSGSRPTQWFSVQQPGARIHELARVFESRGFLSQSDRN
jgi:hypothetical protein